MGDYEEVAPRADAMIASMRAVGYDLPTAVADLIDNSIFAKAKNIWIDYHWAGSDSWIMILDDGEGMSEERLKEAMRLGSQSPLEERSFDDLGRFGLGLKTASFSQCKKLTVHTKTPSGDISTRCWDLDHIEECKKWELCKVASKETKKIIGRLDDLSHGTVVLWEDLDRVVDESIEEEIEGRDVFYKKFSGDVKPYLEMIFHRYLSLPYNLKIKVGKAKLKPWDPYMLSNDFTQPLSNEKYEDGYVKLMPYVLPHVSKRTAEESDIGQGPLGWNRQQGFYLYRNKRMIVSGGYLDLSFKAEDHYKLARIMLDINNTMDQEWKIDVKKATASPPDRLIPELEKVARATRSEAENIYRARLGNKKRSKGKKTDTIWLKNKIGDKIVYKINKSSPVISEILNELKLPAAGIKKLFHVIESTVPHRLIIIDNSEDEDCLVDLPPEINKPGEELLNLCREFYQRERKQGKTHEEAVDIVTSIEPFDSHSLYISTLDELAKGGKV